MSVHLTSEVYRRQVGSLARTAVMVLFADKASDDGSGIWASKQRMADELGTSKQTIIATIRSLISDGLVIEVGERKSPNGFTIEYALDVEALRSLPIVKSHLKNQSSSLTGQTASPVNVLDGTGQAALPHRSSSLTRTIRNHPKPDNKNGKAKAQKSTKTNKSDLAAKPDGLSDQTWKDFLAHRKAKRAPVTVSVMEAIEREIAQAGWTTEDALVETMVRGWQTFKSAWVESKGTPAGSSDPYVASVLARKADRTARHDAELPLQAINGGRV